MDKEKNKNTTERGEVRELVVPKTYPKRGRFIAPKKKKDATEQTPSIKDKDKDVHDEPVTQVIEADSFEPENTNQTEEPVGVIEKEKEKEKETKPKAKPKKKKATAAGSNSELNGATVLFKKMKEFDLIEDREEEHRLILLAQSGDADARDELINRNLRLAAKMAHNFASKGVMPFDDFFQEAVLGLFTAISKFDVSTGFKFSTYAPFWIFQNCNRLISNHSRTIRLPVKVNELLSQYRKIEKEYGEGGFTTEEAAKHLGLTPERLDEILLANQKTHCIDQPLSTDGAKKAGEKFSYSLKDTVSDGRASVEDTVFEYALQEELYETINKLLTEEEKAIILSSFGLQGTMGDLYKPMTLKAIAEQLNELLPNERWNPTKVSKLRKQALDKLKTGIDYNWLPEE